LQDVVNSYKGETWAIRKSKSTPEKVGIKLRTDIPRRLLPDWTRLVTVTIDQQRSDGGYRLWVCLAHGINRAAHVVDYGLCQHLEEVWDRHIRSPYQHEDGGNPMMPHAAAADSGWDTKKTYDFCNAHNGMLPLKGSSGDISGGLPYKVAEVESGQYKGQSLFTVNTDFWETDLQARLDERDPGEDESLSLCAGADGDFEFLEQLCNGTLTDRVDGRNQAKLLWVKKDESLPNDYRDAVRYGLCLAHAYIDENGGYPPRSNVWTQSKTVVNSGTQRPDGRNWNE
jgi:phage terminase large subunit GpA-like protein